MEDDCAEAERRDRAQVATMSGQVARVLDPQHEQRIDVRFFQCRLTAGQPFPPHYGRSRSAVPSQRPSSRSRSSKPPSYVS